MKAARAALLAALVAACGELPTTGDGIAFLQVRVPVPAAVEVGDTLRLAASARTATGDSVPAAVSWATPDTAFTIDASTGLVTGRVAGQTGRAQARTADITSGFVAISVRARADTLIRVAPAQLTVPAADTASPALAVRLATRSGTTLAGAPGLQVFWRVVAPAFATAADATVRFRNGQLADTATTGTDGTPTVPITLRRVAGRTAPDSATVEVTSFRVRGAAVPGSGQRFVIRFLRP